MAGKPDKKCKCDQDTACDCWAFAPLYGDGEGNSGATFPNPNQIAGKAAPAPAAAPAAPVMASKSAEVAEAGEVTVDVGGKPYTVPEWACAELARYNKDAGKRPNVALQDVFAPFKPTAAVTLYRGLGIDKVDGPDFLKKCKLKEPKPGVAGVYKTGKIQSWTTDKKEAEGFAAKFTIAGADSSSLGIVLQASVHPKDIFVAIGNLPSALKQKCIHFDQAEYLLNAGSYSVTIEMVRGPWPTDVSAVVTKQIKPAVAAAAERLMHLTKGTAIKKTWNKAPGFSIEYGQYGDRSWSPSIEVHYDNDGQVWISDFGVLGAGAGGKAHVPPFKTGDMDPAQLLQYLQHGVDKDFKAMHDKAMEIRKAKGMKEHRKMTLADLNEDLDFMNRQVSMPAAPVVVDDPDDDELTNPMIMDDIESIDDIDTVGHTDGGDPLAPLESECGCASYEVPDYATGFDDISAELDAMDAADLDEPSGDDVLDAVLTIINAAMGY